VPVFLVHPLVENAVKHGMQTSAMPLRIRLTAAAKNNSMHLEVANTGRWAAGSTRRANGTGTGLENVRRRLEQTYAGRYRFDVRERDGWVCAKVDIDNQ
jgi:LytS/YehU family sensor histidine kinase